VNQQKRFIRPSSRGRTMGKLHEIEGIMKEVVGRATNNPDLETFGTVEKSVGKIQHWIGRAEKTIGK
jgi:uncharacterized protein YjbJ (UPF0337 family)